MNTLTAPDLTDLCTVTEAADAIGVNVRTIRYRLQRGTMAGVKLGPITWMIPRDEVARCAAEGKRPPGRRPALFVANERAPA